MTEFVHKVTEKLQFQFAFFFRSNLFSKSQNPQTMPVFKFSFSCFNVKIQLADLQQDQYVRH